MRIKDIKLGDRFRQDLGDYKKLAKSIEEIGLLHPVVVNEDNVLIAGARRLEACAEILKWKDIPVTKVNLKQVLKGELHENTVRKNFTFNERNAIREAIKPELEKEAEQRQKAGVPSANFAQGSNHDDNKTDAKLGDFFGISRTTNAKEEAIAEAVESDPDQFGKLPEKIDAGEVSVDYAFKSVKRAQEHIETPDLPTGQYDIIVADPTWEYDINMRGSPDEHYSIMKQKDIEALAIPAADNAIVFLWATNPKLPEALKVMKAWGFKYKSAAVWVKDKIGTGYYFRGQHELLLVGEKGEMPLPMENTRPSSVIESPRLEHSQKPDIVYEIIERMYPNRTYLELFARKKREGWKSWGNEIA